MLPGDVAFCAQQQLHVALRNPIQGRATACPEELHLKLVAHVNMATAPPERSLKQLYTGDCM